MKNTYNKYAFQGKRRYELLLTFIGSFVISILVATVFNTEHYLQNLIISWGISFTGWLGNTWIFRRLIEYYPDYKQNTKRIILSFFFITTYTNLIVFITNIVIAYTLYTPEKIMTLSHFGMSFIIASEITFVITIIHESVHFYSKWKEKSIEAETLKKESVRAQLEGLKNQISPHFLFNSLNTLASIIPEDSDLSVQFVEKLSQVYRYVLQYGEKEKVTLKEELEFIEAYLFLQQIRFGNNIHFQINLSEEERQRNLLPLSLQLLVENAIKHNIVTSRKPLRITLSLENDEMLLITNNLQEKKVYEKSTGVGLKNIQDRYLLIANKSVIIEKTSTEFMVKIPLI